MIAFIFQLLKFRKTLSVAMGLAIVPVVYCAFASLAGLRNDVFDWLPESFEETQRVYEFGRHFGSDELLMVSWEGCTLDDPRLKEFSSKITEPALHDGHKIYYFSLVLDGPIVLDAFTRAPLELSREEATKRMKKWLLSPDGNLTCAVAVVLLSPDGTADRHGALAHVRNAANRTQGLSAEMIHMAGPTMQGVAIDNASSDGLIGMNILSFLVAVAILVFFFRNLRIAALVFLLALFNEIACLTIMHVCGTQLDSILLLASNFNFVLSISIGVHLMNYYRDSMRGLSIDSDMTEPVRSALSMGILPTMLASTTTVIGLLSLLVSELIPIDKFGFYAAMGLFCTTTVVLIYIPLHLVMFPVKSWCVSEQESKPSLLDKFLGSLLPTLVEKAWAVILVVSIVCLGVGFWKASGLEAAAGLDQLLPESSRGIQDYKWLEDRIGPLTPFEITLEFPHGEPKDSVTILRTIEHIHRRVEEFAQPNVVISAVNFVPDIPESKGGFRQFAKIAAFGRVMDEQLPEIEKIGYMRRNATGASQIWRITVRTYSMRDINYGDFLDKVRKTVDEALADLPKKSAEPVKINVSGSIPLIHKAQIQLLQDLKKSYAAAFVLVAVVLIVLFRSISGGLLCMIPNLLPCAIVFGSMAWLGIPVEIGSVLTASTALGISVDDSLHFIHWFRKGAKSGLSNAESVRLAYRSCGKAMVQTSLICGLSLLVFAMSDFLPMVRFGVIMFTLMMIALVCDLVVLPAILVSPLGKLLTGNSRRK